MSCSRTQHNATGPDSNPDCLNKRQAPWVTCKHWPPLLESPTTNQVHRLPWGTVHGPPLRTPFTDHPKNRMKIKHKVLTYELSNGLFVTYGLSNRLLVSVKFPTLRCTNVKGFGFGSQPSYIIIHIAISFVVAIYERLGSLKICVTSPLPFWSAHSPVG